MNQKHLSKQERREQLKRLALWAKILGAAASILAALVAFAKLLMS